MRTLELFSGAGGMALGLGQAGFTHVKFVEFNKHACNTLRTNFAPSLVFEGDVRDFNFEDLSDIDFVAGGPPCQPFSLAGKHKANSDDRDMFPYAVEAIRTLRPKGFMFENVKGLLRGTFSDYFEYVLLRLSYPTHAHSGGKWQENLSKLRLIDKDPNHTPEYDVQYKLLNSANFGVPQTRERVFIVGTRSDLGANFCFPEPTHSKKVLIQYQNVADLYWSKHSIEQPADTQTATTKKERPENQLALFPSALKPWVTVRDALRNVPHPASSHQIEGHVFKDGAKSYPGHTGSYIDLPAKTLKAGVHGVPGGENMIRYEDGSIRYFTVHEGKLLQTFPADYKITGAWGEGMRQIGNAVPVQLAKILGEAIYDALSQTQSDQISAKSVSS